MAWTNWGFDGTINEAQWAQLAPLMGNGHIAKDSASCVVTPVGGARKVSVSTGTLFGDGIVSVSDAAEEVTLTTPVNGQFYVIALKRVWATNTASLVAVAGATTTTTTPTAAPSTLPTLANNPGVETEQAIAWAWANSANTTVVVFDMRQFPVRTMPPTVANAVVRDAKYQTPAQGFAVWRDDLGAIETYYGAYNAISNPGGRDTAGWYVTNRAGGLVPVRPTTVTVASGTASANALGQITFSGATTLSLDGFITAEFNLYEIVMNITGSTNNALLARWITPTGSIITNGYYGGSLYQPFNSGISSDNLRNNGANSFIGYVSSADSTKSITLKGGSDRSFSNMFYHSFDNGYAAYSAGGYHAPTNSTGLQILPASGSISGKISIFGYND